MVTNCKGGGASFPLPPSSLAIELLPDLYRVLTWLQEIYLTSGTAYGWTIAPGGD